MYIQLICEKKKIKADNMNTKCGIIIGIMMELKKWKCLVFIWPSVWPRHGICTLNELRLFWAFLREFLDFCFGGKFWALLTGYFGLYTKTLLLRYQVQSRNTWQRVLELNNGNTQGSWIEKNSGLGFFLIKLWNFLRT